MISRDDWLKALEEVQSAPLPASDAISVTEFAVMTRVTNQTAARHLRTLVMNGKATRCRKPFRRGDGVIITVPAYRLVP